MFSGHPILDEIKKGFKLRPTKTVDKSKPIIYAEGEDENEVAPTKRAPPAGGILPPGQAIPKPTFIPPPLPPSANGITLPPPPVITGPGGIPPPPPMLTGAIPPPPPPPMMGGANAPPAPRPKTPLNPKFSKLGGKSPGTVDRGELLKGIQGGFQLRKTVTNDKSGLIVDEDMREKSVTLVEPTQTTYIPPPPSQSRPHSSLGFDSSDTRFRRTPEPQRDDSPEPLLGQRRPIVMRMRGEPPPPPPEFGFDSEKQKITSEDIEKEIKKGSVASKMAALMGNMGFSQDKIDQVGTGTLPRAAFRRSPLRSSIMSTSSEVNNNDGSEAPKPKPVSKWHVDTNYGLRTASRSNVPLEKQERASSVLREKSSSWLDLSRAGSAQERARTQSPIPFCERIELDKIDIDNLPDVIEEPAKSTTPPKKRVVKKKAKVPEPISVNTDFCTTGARRPSATPQIQETPPTPAQKKTYGYSSSKSTSTYRSASPDAATSPISSMSSAPSPSSLSAGSVSPDSVPKKRNSISNPNFEKAKEKWGAAVRAEDRDSATPTRGGTSRETTPVVKKVTPPPCSTPPAPCFATTGSKAEAKGAAAVAKAKCGVRRKKKSSTTNAPIAPAPCTTTPSDVTHVVPKTKSAYGQPEPGTVKDRASKFREQLQADDDKGKKPWQHPFMPISSPSPPPSRVSAREQLFSSSTLPRSRATLATNSISPRVINVPISVPWYTPDRSRVTPVTSVNVMSPLSKYSSSPFRDQKLQISSYDDPYSHISPSQLRDHLRFNIDVSHDLPLTISRR